MARSTLRAKEAAAYLGISYWLILELAKKKEIPHIRAGSRVLFRRESLDEWMQNQEAASVGEG
jgi:excisionase family DNA binding protein